MSSVRRVIEIVDLFVCTAYEIHYEDTDKTNILQVYRAWFQRECIGLMAIKQGGGW